MYIHTGNNLGFGRAHNLALKTIAGSSKYHLVLNPDISFGPGVLEELHGFMEVNPEIGWVMPQIHYPDGSLQNLCKRLPGPWDLFRRQLQQITGIGPILALTILAEADDPRRFGHHRQFLKFCGLDLSTQQSGQFRGTTRLSKYGNARLRCAFWMAATIVVRQTENSFCDKFERYLRCDPTSADRKRMAYVAVAAKMARGDLWDHQNRNRLPLLPCLSGRLRWNRGKLQSAP